MKERDLSESLRLIKVSPELTEVCPFVLVKEGDTLRPLWLATGKSIDDCRRLATLPRAIVPKSQSLDSYMSLPQRNVRAFVNGEHRDLIVYEGVPDAIKGDESELFLIWIAPTLCLWGIYNRQ